MFIRENYLFISTNLKMLWFGLSWGGGGEGEGSQPYLTESVGGGVKVAYEVLVLNIIFSQLIFHSSWLNYYCPQLKHFFCTQSTRRGWCTRARVCTLWVLEMQMRQWSRLSWPGLPMVGCSSQLRLTTRPLSKAVWLCKTLTLSTYVLLWVYLLGIYQLCKK